MLFLCCCCRHRRHYGRHFFVSMFAIFPYSLYCIAKYRAERGRERVCGVWVCFNLLRNLFLTLVMASPVAIKQYSIGHVLSMLPNDFQTFDINGSPSQK